MIVNYRISKKINGKIVHENYKIRVHSQEWENDNWHRKLRIRIYTKHPGWLITEYEPDKKQVSNISINGGIVNK